LTPPLRENPSEYLDVTYPAKKLEGWGYCIVKIA